MGLHRRLTQSGRPAASPLSTLGILFVAVAAVILLAPATKPGAKSRSAGPRTAHTTTRARTVALTPSVPLTGSAFDGTPAVGALFQLNGSSLGDHFCTASVVDSATRDLIITAAHCVDAAAGSGSLNLAFAPGYHGGQTPYGVWIATQAVVDPEWSATADPDHDVAFVVVRRPGSDAKIEDVTGAEKLGVGQPSNGLVRVIGYPDTADRPISCQNRTSSFSARQMRFDCQNYTDGTSGGPFLANVHPGTGRGAVIGVIGGHEQGGDTPSVSYSARFGQAVRNLYNNAVRKN
jgi:V8-like Glu-specific endopeptidase